MSNGDPRQLPTSGAFLRRSRLAAQALMFMVGGLALTIVELAARGRVTTPPVGLFVIGAFVLGVGMIIDARAGRRRPGDDPGDDDGSDGGGGSGLRPQPELPSGGLQIDWEKFERDFRAYADRVTVCAVASVA